MLTLPRPSATPRVLRRLVCVAALAACSPGWAADLILAPSTGLLSVNGGTSFASQVMFNGSLISAGALVGGVREYKVLGDLNVGIGDRVSADNYSTAGVRFIVGNDALIRGSVDLSARGALAGAGGGRAGGSAGDALAGALSRNPTPLANGGARGHGGQATRAAFGFLIDPFEFDGAWINSWGGDIGSNGDAGRWGADSAAGGRGASGGAGGAGRGGVNNVLASFSAGGGGGAQGGNGGRAVGAGAGGSAGNGGEGAKLQASNSLTISYSRNAQPGGSGTKGADGYWGVAGSAGTSGGAGENASNAGIALVSLANRTVRNRDATVFGGNGGGAGGSGAQGGQGSGGGQGGGGGAGGGAGGDNYCDGGCGIAQNFGSTRRGNHGGAGGNGGAGGDGGAGGPGGAGGAGGGGGGALEIVARGTVTVGGNLTVAGGDGAAGRAGTAGLAGAYGRAGQAGRAGDSSSSYMSYGGNGAAGGNGGKGGDGGLGGAGAAGGGGSGGSVRIVASRIVDEQASFNTRGGLHGNINGYAGPGHVFYGSNEGDRLNLTGDMTYLGARIVDDTSLKSFGTRGANPLVRRIGMQSAQTPFVSGRFLDDTPLFAGGAERFGLVSRAVAQEVAPFVQQLRDAAPGGGIAALARRSSFAGLVMEGFDALVMVNLTGDALSAPRLVARIGEARQALQALFTGGWAADPEFGGTGFGTLSELEAEGLYLTFIPTGSSVTSFGFAAGGVASATIYGLTLDGQAAYLIGTPVPEPTSVVLMALGVAVFSLRRFHRA